MTLYNFLRQRLGLSQSEAAELHGVRLDTVKSWCAGRNRPRPGVFDDLRQRERQARSRAEGIQQAALEAGGGVLPARMEVSLSGGDPLALAIFALELSGGAEIEIVEPGSTPAVEAARTARRMAGS